MPSQPDLGATTKTHHRLGPQPLPLHLGLALTTWSNSATILPSLMLAWQHLKAQADRPGADRPGKDRPAAEKAAVNGAPPEQPQRQQAQPEPAYPMLQERLAQALRQLGPQLDAADPAALAKALSDEGLRRLDAFVTGALAYRRQPENPRQTTHRVAWSSGSTRLLDYSPAGTAAAAPRILVSPSLINR